MRARVQEQFEKDLPAAKKAEIGLLAEANLRNNLERQRTLFNSVVDQLKQAQLVSDFGSITAQTLNPPSVERDPAQKRGFILVAALLAGARPGGGDRVRRRPARLADPVARRDATRPEPERARDHPGADPRAARRPRGRSA